MLCGYAGNILITRKDTDGLELTWGNADTLPKIDFHALREGFYVSMGWGAKTGIPSKQTLTDLGLDALTWDLVA